MNRSITEPEASSFTFKGGELRDLLLCDIFSRNTFHFPLRNGWEDQPDLPIRPLLVTSTGFFK